MRIARQMLADGRKSHSESMALGPSLGQCCGGAIVLHFDEADALSVPEGDPLWIWGAGHVGRALVDVLAPTGAFAITWVDVADDRFPDHTPPGVSRAVAVEPHRLVRHSPAVAHHLIVTYSHDLDLKLCDALLRHGFASAGLIGSATKWARFRSRLAELSHADAQISRIACPIGNPALGKHPQAIAVGTAAALLSWADRQSVQGDDGA